MNDEWQKNWLNSSVIILHSRLLVILTSDSWLLDSVTSDNPCLASVKYLSDGVEQIVIKSACSEAALPSVIRALMLGDVPTSIWWTEDLSGTRPVAPLVIMGRQLLYDSRCWRDVGRAVLALAPLLEDPFGPDLADVNWRRLQPVRRTRKFLARSA